MYHAAVLTVSDRVSRGERPDEGGPLVAELLKNAGYEVVRTDVVPDEQAQIEAALRQMADDGDIQLLVTTGGTGFAPRDVTPEATLAVCDRLTPGIPEAMRYASLQVTPRAMLSRAQAGIRGGSLIVNLPGSPKAARENLAAVLPTLRSRCVECKLSPAETEETPPSPRAEAFLRALAGGKRGQTAAACVRLEREKLTGDDLEAFCTECRDLLARALKLRYGASDAGKLPRLLAKSLTNQRLMRTIELLERFRRDCRFHIAPDQALGALAAEVEELL